MAMTGRVGLLARTALTLAALSCGDSSDDDSGGAADAAAPGERDAGSDSGQASAPGPLMYTGDFTMGTTIPPRHKCLVSVVGGGKGDNLSPPLEWRGGPEATRSFAVVLFDTRYNYFHWAIWDIPADVYALPEAIAPAYDVADPAGAHQAGGPTAADEGYFGPCSDAGPAAGTYEYRLFALSEASLALTDSSTAAEIQAAIEAAELERTVWEGTPE